MDIYRLYSLLTPSIGELTDIYGLFLYARCLQANLRTFIGYVLCTPLIGELTDIYRLYSLCTLPIGELADIYRLCFSCTLSIGELTDIYRLCLSTSSMGKLIDIYGQTCGHLWANLRTFMGYIVYTRHLWANLWTFMGSYFFFQ